MIDVARENLFYKFEHLINSLKGRRDPEAIELQQICLMAVEMIERDMITVDLAERVAKAVDSRAFVYFLDNPVNLQ